MQVCIFSSWQVRCGIADYTAHLAEALSSLDELDVSIVPYDRQQHPRSDYIRWGQQMNRGMIAHIQHEYAFFGYLLPWSNHFDAFVSQIHKPLVITKHVSFDGPLLIPGRGLAQWLRLVKWSLYNRWLGPYATYLNRDTFDVADQIIVLSARLRTQLIARGINSEKISVIPPAVPRVPQALGGHRLRGLWGWEDKYIIGMFGFITPAKGHRIALESLGQLPEKYVLLIAGSLRRRSDSSVLQEIDNLCAKLDLRNRVRITGYIPQNEIPALIDACDVLIYPHTHVDFSYSVMTGLAYQTVPIITSDVFAYRELAGAGAGIALFRSNSAADLTRTIQMVVQDKTRRIALLHTSARYAQSNTWQNNAIKTVEVYKRAMSAKR